ncbi:MAG TPA: cobalamin-binding protein [Gammaproteobacteria bacterium]|nr:cobalamin-binding protein [Gammaproteobacteria bacterium]
MNFVGIVIFRVAVVMAGIFFALRVSAEVAAVDDVGTKVSLSSPATRIISLAPNLTEVLFFIGAGEQVVGAVEYSDFPAAARALPLVGSHNRFDVEQILSLKPDLIVAWMSGNSQDGLQALKQLGLPVFVSESATVDDIVSLMERLGELTGNQTQAVDQASRFRASIDKLSEAYSKRRPVRVFYQVWEQPIYTLNGDHVISHLITLCGGRNIFSELIQLAPIVSLESVLARNPEVIVGGGVFGETPPWVTRWQGWSTVSAVQDQHIYAIDSDHIARMGPRLAQGMEALCRIIDKVRNAS